MRDLLMGCPPKDLDLIAALPAAELERFGFHRVEPKNAPSIYLRWCESLGKIEVSLLGSTGFLETDLRRRDFTANAIALSLNGDLLDPLGGQQALRERLLIPCSDTAFAADPIRIFRGYRFETDGWRMAGQAEVLIRKQRWGELFRKIPMERFSGEMLKALSGEEPSRFFRRMAEFGAGEEFLPELFRMTAIPAGPPQYHPEGNLLTHALLVLDRVAAKSDDVVARFCALFHDLGKLATPPELYPRHHGHDVAGFHLARSFCDRLALPVAFRTALIWSNRLHTTANRWEELRDSTKVRLAEQAVKGKIAASLPLIVAADKPGGEGMPGWDEAIRVVRLTTTELDIDPRLLGAHPIDGVVPLPPEQRPALIHQKRVEVFRELVKPKNSSS